MSVSRSVQNLVTAIAIVLMVANLVALWLLAQDIRATLTRLNNVAMDAEFQIENHKKIKLDMWYEQNQKPKP